MTLRAYLDQSRAPRYTILFAVPLLLAYEVLALALSESGSGVRNGADVLLKSLFVAIGGGRGLLVFNLLLLGAGAMLVWRDWHRHRGTLSPRIFGLMFAESAVLALVVGVVVGQATRALLQHLSIQGMTDFGLGTQLMLSLGAGLYEELLFRVMLVGALALLGERVFGWPRRQAGIMACVVGALLFSAFHYIGPYGDTWQLTSFTFRALAGLVFSALYLTRGFGITAWTHALYDVYVTIG